MAGKEKGVRRKYRWFDKLPPEILQPAMEEASKHLGLAMKLAQRQLKWSQTKILDSEVWSAIWQGMVIACIDHNPERGQLSTVIGMRVISAILNWRTKEAERFQRQQQVSSFLLYQKRFADYSEPQYFDEREDRRWRVEYTMGMLSTQHRYLVTNLMLHEIPLQVVADTLRRDRHSVATSAGHAANAFRKAWPPVAQLPRKTLQARLDWRDACIQALPEKQREQLLFGVSAGMRRPRYGADFMRIWCAHPEQEMRRMTIDLVSWVGLIPEVQVLEYSGAPDLYVPVVQKRRRAEMLEAMRTVV